MSIPFIRSPYNYDSAQVSHETGLLCEDPTLAIQSAKDECDINTIVRRFGLTGELPSGIRAPTYDDFTGLTDFHSAMNAVAVAGESFDSMPAEVRSRFNNSPGEFVDFCSNEANRSEAERLGLVFARPPETVPDTSGAIRVPPAGGMPLRGTPDVPD